MRKRLLVALMVLVGLSTVAWASAQSEGTKAPALDQPSKIQVWVQADAVRYPGFEAVTAEFEKKYPKIDVELTNVPGGWEDLYRKLLATYVSKSWPDVLYAKGDLLVDYASRGMLSDLTQFWKRDKDTALNASPVFQKHVEQGCSWQGKIYGLPRGQYWMTFSYNKDLFAQAGLTKAPSTWEELRNYSIKIKALAPDIYGFAMYTTTRNDPTGRETMLDSWTRQNGGSIMEYKAGKPVYNLAGNEKAEQALAFLRENLWGSKSFLPPDKDSTRETLQFAGKVAMWWGHGGHVSRYVKAAPNMNWTMDLMPGQVHATYIADQKWMVSGNSDHVAQGWEYIKHFTSKEMEALFAPYEGHLSVWQDNWKLPVYSHQAFAGLIKQLQDPGTEAFQIHPKWTPASAAIAKEVQKVLFNQLSPAEALKAAQKGVEAALAD
jgi:multiple sugar transport system substrate-binding protein